MISPPMECCIEILSSGCECISHALGAHRTVNYGQLGGFPGKRAGKQRPFFRDLCELVERDELEATAILDLGVGS